MGSSFETCLMLPRTGNEHHEQQSLYRRVLVESKKLWSIVGPAILVNLLNFTTIVITQAFAGHLGDFEFASISVSNSLIFGFNNGLMVRKYRYQNPNYIYMHEFLQVYEYCK